MLIPMKKATLYALLQDKESILLALQRCGEFMVIEPETGPAVECTDKAEQEAQRIGASIRFLSRHEGKKPLFAPRQAVRYDRFIQEDETAVRLAQQAEHVAEELHAAKAEQAHLLSQAQQLLPWEELDIAIENIKPTAYARFAAGYVVPSGARALVQAAEEAGAQVQLLGAGPEGQAVFAVFHVQQEAQVRDALKNGGFVNAVLPRVSGTPGGAIAALKARAEEAEKKAAALEEEAGRLSAQKAELQMLYDRRKAERDRNAALFAQSRYTFCLQGWVRKDRADEVQKAVASACEAFDLAFEDPADGEMPPTVVQNPPVVRPFEFVTDLYSRPSPFGYDPNTVLAVFYVVFFGMMVSDAGYGIVLTVLLLAARRLLKPKGALAKIMGVVLFGAISTVFWGFSFGGIFGLSIPPLMFNPLEEPISMLLLCYALGIVHVFTGMSIKMVLNFKAGDWKAAVFDQLSWMLLIIGCIMLALPATAPVGKYLAIYGAGSILVMAGRDKKNIVKRLTSGLGSLYGISGYLSDILSYSRLFAMGLATGVIAMVINTIAKMLMSGQGILAVFGFIFGVAIMAGGHAFNIAVNTLGAFVHSARLQYIEFFSKFYEAGGKEFKPLSIRAKYIDVLR